MTSTQDKNEQSPQARHASRPTDSNLQGDSLEKYYINADVGSEALSFGERLKRRTTRTILNMTPSWFSVNMGTGVVSILLHQLPFSTKALPILSDVVFGLNVFLFALFLSLSLARYTLYPRVGSLMLLHPVQSLYLGTFPMGLCTLLTMASYACIPQFGPAFTVFVFVLWSIASLISLLTCVGLPFLQMTRHDQLSIQTMTGAWLLPVVAPVVSASTGSVFAAQLVSSYPNSSSWLSHARTTILVSYVSWATAVPVAFILFTLLWARLVTNKIPPAALSSSSFLPLGPCGLGGFTILNLARVGQKLAMIPEAALIKGGSASNQLAFDSPKVIASAVYGVSLLLSLLMWGLGLVFLLLAVSTVVDMAFASGGLPFNMGSWGFTFPLGVYAVSTLTLAEELDSAFFKYLGTVFSGAVFLLWLLLAIMTTYGAITGELFHAPCLAEIGGQVPETVPFTRLYPHESPPDVPSQENTRTVQQLTSMVATKSRGWLSNIFDNSRKRRTATEQEDDSTS